MRAAIIGAGFAGQVHAAALKACGVELAAVVTSHEETARAFAEKWNIPNRGTDLSLAFEPGINAVHICTPPTTHGKMVRELLSHGKNVLCEKPLCFDLEEAYALAQAAKESECLCALTFNVRYHMACQKARELIASGQFGRPLIIHGNYMQEFNAFPAPLDWRYDPVLAGNMRAVTEIGSHWLDLAQYISGKKVTAVSALFGRFNPERVLAEGMTYPLSSDIKGERVSVISEDAAAINLQYEDGAIGSVLLSEISPGRGNRLSLEVTCEYGNLWWNAEDNNILHTARKGEGVHSEIFAFGNGFTDTFRTLLENYYAAIASGHPSGEANWPTFDEGAQITALCHAIAESAAQDSRWIRV